MERRRVLLLLAFSPVIVEKMEIRSKKRYIGFVG
jgi:hypothetical protein